MPEEIVAELTASEDAAATGVEIAARFIRGAREMCDGIHIMAIGAEHLAPRVIEAAGQTLAVRVQAVEIRSRDDLDIFRGNKGSGSQDVKSRNLAV